MANTSSRALRLLSLLQTHRYWLGSELADRLEVSLRTLRRDVDRLRELGYPVQADRGVGGGYQLAPGASLPPLVLDDDEAVALAVGLLTAAQDTVSGVAESSVQALAKVIQVMPPRLRRRVEALRSATVRSRPGWAVPAVEPRLLTSVAQACRDQERITFHYVAADGAVSERRAEPRQLVSHGSRWYLVCYDLGRGAWRSFRLDRMSEVALTGARFAPRDVPGGDAAAFVEAGIRRTALVATAELAAPAEVVRERIGAWSDVTAIAEDRCRVEMDADSLDWALFAVGVSGAKIITADPPEFAERLRDWSRRFGSVGETDPAL